MGKDSRRSSVIAYLLLIIRLDVSHMMDNEWLGTQNTIQPTLELVNRLWRPWAKLGLSVTPLLQPGKISMQDL